MISLDCCRAFLFCRRVVGGGEVAGSLWVYMTMERMEKVLLLVFIEGFGHSLDRMAEEHEVSKCELASREFEVNKICPTKKCPHHHHSNIRGQRARKAIQARGGLVSFPFSSSCSSCCCCNQKKRSSVHSDLVRTRIHFFLFFFLLSYCPDG